MKQYKTLCLVMVLLVGAALLFSGPVQQESARELFEKAIFLEESKGDLEGAIELFQKVVKDFPDERTTAAQALFHVGICYEKLGMREAQKAFQNVIDSYPDQSETVKLARAKLAAISRAKSPPQAEDQSVSLKQVWSGAGVDALGAVSPLGDYIAFTDWDTGDLAVRDIAAGKNRRITDKGPWLKSQEFALFPKWSQDGQYIVYDWFNPQNDRFEIHKVSLKDSKPAMIYDTTEYEYVQPFDIHPNGEQAIVGFYKDEDICEIGLLTLKDQSVQILKTFKQDYSMNTIWGFVISPDGRTIAYDNQYQNDPKTRDIFLLSADGKEELRLTDHPAVDFVLDWTSDGRHLLFGSGRTGTTDMYIIRIEEGKPLGEAILVKPNLDPLFPMGCTRQDQFFYGLYGRPTDIYVAEIDPVSGEFLATPEKKVRHYEGRNAFPDYSPDGKYIAYVSSRGFPEAKKTISIGSLESGEIRDLDPGLNTVNGPQWRPDGMAISMMGSDEDSGRGIYQIVLRSEEVSPLVQIEKTETINSHRWSVDGSTLYYTRSKTRRGSPFLIYTLDVKTGQTRELPGSPENAREIDVSPDGKWIVYSNRSSERILGIIPTAGGEAQELCSFYVIGEMSMTLAWTPDGKYIYFSSKDQLDDGEWDMWRFSMESKQVQQLSFKGVGFRHPSIHPDGRHMVFSTEGDPSHHSGVWMIENFLPKADTKK